VTGKKIKPIFHMGASIGHEVPVWDSHDRFRRQPPCWSRTWTWVATPRKTHWRRRHCAEWRGHGATVAGKNIRHAVYISVYLEVNAAAAKAGHGHGRSQVS